MCQFRQVIKLYAIYVWRQIAKRLSSNRGYNVFEVSKADKYASVCSSCGRHIDNGEVLTEIKIISKNKTISVGRFCKDCLEELTTGIIRAL